MRGATWRGASSARSALGIHESGSCPDGLRHWGVRHAYFAVRCPDRRVKSALRSAESGRCLAESISAPGQVGVSTAESKSSVAESRSSVAESRTSTANFSVDGDQADGWRDRVGGARDRLRSVPDQNAGGWMPIAAEPVRAGVGRCLIDDGQRRVRARRYWASVARDQLQESRVQVGGKCFRPGRARSLVRDARA